LGGNPIAVTTARAENRITLTFPAEVKVGTGQTLEVQCRY
jgi:hypothetical protein